LNEWRLVDAKLDTVTKLDGAVVADVELVSSTDLGRGRLMECDRDKRRESRQGHAACGAGQRRGCRQGSVAEGGVRPE
jgi:hypothetical protein